MTRPNQYQLQAAKKVVAELLDETLRTEKFNITQVESLSTVLRRIETETVKFYGEFDE